jgi:signal transduction histidine kinase
MALCGWENMLFGSISSSQAIQRWTQQWGGQDTPARTGPRLGVRAVAAFFIALLFSALWWFHLLPAESAKAIVLLCTIEILSLPVYLYFFRRFHKRTLQVYCHWVTDILLMTVGMHYLGGEQSFVFSFAYCLVILSTSMVARKRDSFILATLSALCYGTLLYLEGSGVIARREVWDLSLGSSERILFPIWSAASFFLTAYFSSLLSDRLRQRGRVLEMVNAISRVSASSLELQGMLSRVLSFVLEHLKAEYGLIRLTNHWPETRIVEKETRRVPENLSEEEKETLEKLVRMLLEENEPTIIRDLTTDPRSRSLEIRWKGSLIAVPIVHKGESVGVFVLFGKKGKEATQRRRFRRGDLDLLIMITRQISAAIVNARLYTNLEEANLNIRRAQDEIVKAEKFEALGEMVTGLGHQFRNPLLAIGAAAKRLDKGNKIPDASRFYLQIIQKETEKLEKILKDVPGFHIGKECNRRESDVNVLVEKSLSLVLESENKRAITIERDYAMLKEPLPNVDADQLEVALYNIFSNASEAMGSEGTLTVKTRVVSGTESRVLWIEVSDTGGGISPEEVENIFNPFYTTKHWGTGLGLTMTHRIVENHGGDIRVLNRPGEGVTFQITIPNA